MYHNIWPTLMHYCQEVTGITGQNPSSRRKDSHAMFSLCIVQNDEKKVLKTVQNVALSNEFLKLLVTGTFDSKIAQPFFKSFVASITIKGLLSFISFVASITIKGLLFFKCFVASITNEGLLSFKSFVASIKNFEFKHFEKLFSFETMANLLSKSV